jgi:hypothetical protein
MDKALKKLKITFWLIFALTMGIYATMLFWSLPIITNYSGGLLPFDLRPTGYNLEEAKALLVALSTDGVDFYKNIQLKLDTIYPALMAISLILAYKILAPKKLGRWRALLYPFAVFAAIFDYLENYSINKMLQLGSDKITPDLVLSASGFSTTKALFVTISLSILLVLIILWAYSKFTNNRQA